MDQPPVTIRPSRPRAIATAVGVFYVLLFIALIWPVYPRFATIEPRVLEMPFSLFYVVVGLLLSFFVLLGYYFWERGAGAADDPGADRGVSGAPDPSEPDRTL